MLPPPPRSTLFPYTTLFRSLGRCFPAVSMKLRSVPAALTANRPDYLRCGSSRISQNVSLTSGNLRSEEHTSELQSHVNLVCRLLLEKKNMRQLGGGILIQSY